MKMKRLCALAVLLTSSLVSAADGVVADLEGNYSPSHKSRNRIE